MLFPKSNSQYVQGVLRQLLVNDMGTIFFIVFSDFSILMCYAHNRDSYTTSCGNLQYVDPEYVLIVNDLLFIYLRVLPVIVLLLFQASQI